MKITPSYASALLAGLWSGLGVLPLTRASGGATLDTVLWVLMLMVFFFAPMYFLVFGRGESFGPDWIHDPAGRARYFAMLKRLAIYAAAAAAMAGVVWLVTRLL
jgi:hypothetical protein